MRRNLFALAAVLALLATGLEAHAVCTAGNANANVIESTPTSAFTDNGNGTVTHNLTGLIWKQCAEGLSGANCATGSATTFSWANALIQAKNANFAGQTDWRLPNLKELDSIVESCGYSPPINQTLFPATPATPTSYFWSGSSYVPNPAVAAWVVVFYNGLTSTGGKTNPFFVRLVRGGVDSFDLLGGFSVTYNGNGSTGGSVPTDGNGYAAGATVTVLGNTGSLVKTGSTFAGWNTAANGSGTAYAAAATFAIGAGNVTLYAQWTLIGPGASAVPIPALSVWALALLALLLLGFGAQHARRRR